MQAHTVALQADTTTTPTTPPDLTVLLAQADYILSRNKMLIQVIERNHKLATETALTANEPLIRELNNNLSQVRARYRIGSIFEPRNTSCSTDADACVGLCHLPRDPRQLQPQ